MAIKKQRKISPKAQSNAMANYLRAPSVGANMGSATPNRWAPPQPAGAEKASAANKEQTTPAAESVVAVPVSILGANPAIGDSVTFEVMDLDETEARLGKPSLVKATGQPSNGLA
jgi:hypothetical protein